VPATQATAATRTIDLPPETVQLQASPLAGYSIAREKCGICHSADYILYQPPHLSQAQWTAEMQKMQRSYGAPLDSEEIKLLGIYFAVVYGDASTVSAGDRALTRAQVVQPSVRGASASADIAAGQDGQAQALLTNKGCLTCHGFKQKVVGPAYQEIAAKYHGDPNALAKVAANIRAGGSGKWGQVPMPPFPDLSETELNTLARFVLAQ
jgi:cytochrome c551/c552